ncbi:MAG: hypothetical protein ABL889_22410, partial [Terricaulis sp.]
MRIASLERPDFAVVDIDLCGRNDGLTVVQRLNEELGIKAVFASGQADVARNHRSGALGIIHKPYDANQLTQAILVLEAVLEGRAPPLAPPALELFHSARQPKSGLNGLPPAAI